MKNEIYKIGRNLGLDKKDIDNVLSANPKELYKGGTYYGTVSPKELYKGGNLYGTVSPQGALYKGGTYYGTISPKDLL